MVLKDSNIRKPTRRHTMSKKYLQLLSQILVVAFLILYGGSFCNAANWYVDKSATGSNNGTSWANAWTSFAAMQAQISKVNPGDTIYISGGTVSKTYTESLTISASGTADSRITVRVGQESPHNGTVIFDAGGTRTALAVAGNYVTVDGSVSGATRWKIHNGQKTARSNWPLVSVTGTHDIVKYLEVYDASNGIGASAARYFEFAYLKIYQIYGDYLLRVTSSVGEVGSNKIHHSDFTARNDASGCGPDGIQATYSVDIYNNTFRATMDTPIVECQHQDMVQSDFHRMRFWNNTFLGGGSQLLFRNYAPNLGPTAIENFVFYNNVVVAAGWQGVLVPAGSLTTSISNWLIANNTWVDCRYHYAFQISLPDSSTRVTNVTVKNNLFYNSGNSSKEVAASQPMTTSQCAAVSWDYNLINKGAAGDNRFLCNWTPISQAHGQTGAPSFVAYTPDSLSSDLHLAGGDTAARGKGANLTSLLTAGGLPTTDMDGNPRPATGSWSIGAYEVSEGRDAASIAQTPSSDGGSGGCFIATAAYGSYLDPHVYVLRKFRDRYLFTNSLGQAFVKSYYRYSPPFADFVSKHETLKTAVRGALTLVVCCVEYPYTGASILLIIPAGIILALRRRKVKRYH